MKKHLLFFLIFMFYEKKEPNGMNLFRKGYISVSSLRKI